MSELALRLYRTVFLIRCAEDAIIRYYPENEMKTPMHMSMGEEAIVAGVCHALAPADQALGTYRSHALYLAKTLGDTDGFFAELYGKETGCARGKAGSMHLSSPEHGLLACSAIVGSSIPVAVGAAFAHKYRGDGRRVAAFFGDGAMDEGVFWESLNFASLHGLPVLFICEDNSLAVHTQRHNRHGFRAIGPTIAQFECNVVERDTTDVQEVHDTTRSTLALMQENGRPAFLRFRYYRYLEHVGINPDFDAGYRSIEEFHPWNQRDPVAVQRRNLLAFGVPESTIVELETAVSRQVQASVEKAKSARFASPSEIYAGVFH